MNRTEDSKISAFRNQVKVFLRISGMMSLNLYLIVRAIKNASVIPFDFKSLDGSTNETELLNKIKEEFHKKIQKLYRF